MKFNFFSASAHNVELSAQIEFISRDVRRFRDDVDDGDDGLGSYTYKHTHTHT